MKERTSESVVELFRETVECWQQQRQRVLLAYGISPLQYQIIHIVADRKQQWWPSQQLIADQLGLNKMTFSKMIRRAQTEGLITRIPSPVFDKRTMIVRPSQKSMNALEKLAKTDEHFFSPLTKAERAQLERIYRKLMS